MNFIEKIDFKVNLEKIKQDLEHILNIYAWPPEDFINHTPSNQIGLTYRKNAEDIWLDAGGSLYDHKIKKFIAEEKDFTEFNSEVGSYTKNIINELSKKENIDFGRIRYMKADQKRGLSIHKDLECRYHLVIKTNPGALFGEYHGAEGVAATCFHLPADGYFYKVDTTRDHFIYNGGWDERIHLVLCEIKK